MKHADILSNSGPEFISAKILQDQLADIRSGVLISMPISTLLSGLILTIHLLGSAGSAAALMWFGAVNLVNVLRIWLVMNIPDKEPSFPQDCLTYTSAHLRRFKALALLSGLIWALLAVLTNGYAAPYSTTHLVILAGISAGAVTYAGSSALVAVNFIVPPLLVLIVCLLALGGIENYALSGATLLFLAGLIRGAYLGQGRFCEASRLKHEAKHLAADMEQKSRQDALTGLSNRRGLEQAIVRLQITDGPYITLLVDLDGFKSVNDTYGHKIGDELLRTVASRISASAPSQSTLARIGGDEFVIIYPAGRDNPPPDQVAEAIITAITMPYPGVASVRIGASIGIYFSHQLELTNMLLRADIALYTAKRRGRNEYYLFDQLLEDELDRRQCIERDLRFAIENGELQIWFQPIYRLEGMALTGFEALLRWRHTIHGNIAPPQIVGAARETGLLQSLTDNVFHQCCVLIDKLHHADRRSLRIAMNLSPHELQSGSVDDMILSGLHARSLPTTMFEIEITEEAPVDWLRVGQKVIRLADMGVSIALDDFGTGFSTLASLKDGRISKVKIDKQFIYEISKSPKDQLLVKALTRLGNSLGIEVVAEGVETSEDYRTLQSLGCNSAQGYYFSKALPLTGALELALATGNR
ncbi:putative bifunctional diguanylate cyclase/phosphodiesterase [Phyllobacterium ifriqiyense]|uniref:putative bifunctional diguanylate cyclase/phosphodiesterase n=1 Tax=Phyllobacterium ifriqiyense TaxID=314238 RepID=UPI00339A6BBA